MNENRFMLSCFKSFLSQSYDKKKIHLRLYDERDRRTEMSLLCNTQCPSSKSFFTFFSFCSEEDRACSRNLSLFEDAHTQEWKGSEMEDFQYIHINLVWVFFFIIIIWHVSRFSWR